MSVMAEQKWHAAATCWCSAWHWQAFSPGNRKDMLARYVYTVTSMQHTSFHLACCFICWLGLSFVLLAWNSKEPGRCRKGVSSALPPRYIGKRIQGRAFVNKYRMKLNQLNLKVKRSAVLPNMHENFVNLPAVVSTAHLENTRQTLARRWLLAAAASSIVGHFCEIRTTERGFSVQLRSRTVSKTSEGRGTFWKTGDLAIYYHIISYNIL